MGVIAFQVLVAAVRIDDERLTRLDGVRLSGRVALHAAPVVHKDVIVLGFVVGNVLEAFRREVAVNAVTLQVADFVLCVGNSLVVDAVLINEITVAVLVRARPVVHGNRLIRGVLTGFQLNGHSSS